MTSRLPTPGSDDGAWGNILNDFLNQAHKSDGSLKDDVVTANVLADGVITTAKIASAGIAESAVTNLTSDLAGKANQSDFTALQTTVSGKADSAGLAAVATSGSYADLTNKPTLPSAQVNSDWNATGGIAQLLNKPTLAAVATSGSYSDLSGKPTIPTQASDVEAITRSGGMANTAVAPLVWLNAADYGAKFDARKITVTTSASSTTLSSTGLSVNDIGRTIAIPGAGSSGATLTTTIVSVAGPNSCQLATVAITAVNGITAWLGTDDTAAIMAAIGAVISNSAALILPVGATLITSALIIGLSSGWRIQGVSRLGTRIVQAADNTPIWSFTTSYTNRWTIQSMALCWAGRQSTSAMAGAAGFTWTGASGDGHWGFRIRDIRFENGWLGMGQADQTGTLPLWDIEVEDIDFDGNSWAGPAIAFASNGGSPNISIRGVYIGGLQLATAIGPGVITLKGAHGVSLCDVEFNDVNSTSAFELHIENCSAVSVRNIRTERGAMTGILPGVIRTSLADVTIDGMEVQSKNINVGIGGYAEAISATGGGRVSVKNLKVYSNTLTSGYLYALRSQNSPLFYEHVEAPLVIYPYDTPTQIIGIPGDGTIKWSNDISLGRVAANAWGTTDTTDCLVTGSYVTTARPSASGITGACYFDKTLNKPAWSDGTNWRDATGTIV